MILHNHRPSSILGPIARGHKVPTWLPGRNDLDPEFWAEVKDGPAMALLLRAGIVTVDEGTLAAGESAQEIAGTLGGLTVNQAAPLIESETDRSVLERWDEADERAGIHDLIASRLDELEE